MDSGLEGKKFGIKTAVDEIHNRDDRPPGAMTAEQAALFPVQMQDDDDDPAPPATRKAGRPVGAKNRSTEEWRNFLFARYRSPLIGLAEIAAMDVMQLARELRFETETRKAKPEELHELLRTQIACREKLSPYMHSKMPMAIEAGEHGLINLTIGTLSVPTASDIVDGQFSPMIVDVTDDTESPAKAQKSVNDDQNSVVHDSVVSVNGAENMAFQGKSRTDAESVAAGQAGGV